MPWVVIDPIIYGIVYLILLAMNINVIVTFARPSKPTKGTGLLPWYDKTYFGKKSKTQQESDKTNHYHIPYNNATSSKSPF